MSRSGFLSLFSRAVGVIGGIAAAIRGGPGAAAYGPAPEIPVARPQVVPTLKMPAARGWAPGATPVAAPGLKVTALARDLLHPRQILVLPNGDVLVAESASEGWQPKDPFGMAMLATMTRAGAVMDASPNRIMLFRDANGDGVPETTEVFLEGLHRPYGMALIGDTLYVGNTDAVLAFPYAEGQTRMTGPGRKIMSMKGPAGHWTRNLLPSADGTRLYVAVGSQSNIGEAGLDVEEDRACIFELDLATGQHRLFASGLRNPVGMAREPATGVLWTVVNERDGLGDETPPDYLTSVVDGRFYGWPYCYWNRIVDDRVPQNPGMVAKATQPDFALGGHTASLGLCWLPDNTLPGYPAGMVIGQHGSWNRSKLSGYKVVLVPFEGGRPRGDSIDLLTGFLAPDETYSHGRPVGTALAADGAILVADDVGKVVWRIAGA